MYNIYTYIYIHTYICTSLYIYVHTYIFIYLNLYLCIYVDTSIYLCMYIYTFININIYSYICIYIYIYPMQFPLFLLEALKNMGCTIQPSTPPGRRVSSFEYHPQKDVNVVKLPTVGCFCLSVPIESHFV